MNKTVKHLAGKALDKAVPNTWTTLTAYDLDRFTEAFAELIVRECAKVADDGFASSNFGNGITGHQLLKHFGVEE